MTDHHARAKRIIEQCKALYPIRGLIVSPDLDRLAEYFADSGMTIHSWPSGATCDDWVVPQSWRATHGRLEDSQGRTLASLDQSFLFVAPHSAPVDGWFYPSELHVHTRGDQPGAYVLETRCAYDAQYKTWAITLPRDLYESIRINSGLRYRVVIETETKPGFMHVAERFVPGALDEIICLNSHTDELCNDGFSSALVVQDLIMGLAHAPRQSEYTYHALLTPELLGPIFYAEKFPGVLARTLAMLNFETLGAGTNWALKSSLQGTPLDLILGLALQAHNVPNVPLDFFSGYGNDERVYGWPTLGVPGVSLQRYPFAQYHTSLDTPDILCPRHLATALEVAETCFAILDADYVPEFTRKSPPWLTKHGLYKPGLDRVLFLVDRRRTVSNIARHLGKPFFEVWQDLEGLRRAGLLRARSEP